MKFDYKNKTVVVTGGGTGIGRAICLGFAENGANVAVCYSKSFARAKETAAEVEKLGANAITVKVDVANEEEVNAMVKTVVDTFGSLDILCNNAGIVDATKPLEELTTEEWDAHFNVNAKGVFLCSKAVIPQMRKQGYGRILNTLSQCAKLGMVNYGHYCASKAAALVMSQALALELANTNIRVKSILPGDVNTEMTDREAVLLAERSGEDPEEVRGRIGANVPIGHPASPEEIAKVFLLMASEYADYMTGTSVNVTGGELLY